MSIRSMLSCKGVSIDVYVRNLTGLMSVCGRGWVEPNCIYVVTTFSAFALLRERGARH